MKGELDRHQGDDDILIEASWKSVNPRGVLATKEVFDRVRAKGYEVDYLRVAITDEQSPIPSVVDELINRIKGIPSDCYMIFNCQQGRGRTTTGMLMTWVAGYGLMLQLVDTQGYFLPENFQALRNHVNLIQAIEKMQDKAKAQSKSRRLEKTTAS